MAAAVEARGGLWDALLELTKSAQEKNSDPFHWAIQLSSSLNSAGVTQPCVELAHLLVSHICWSNNVPIAWKFLDKALALKIAPPSLVLALLSTRVIPSRHLHPAAYRLYIELLRRHGSSYASQLHGSSNENVMKAIDNALHLSDVFGVQASDSAVLVVLFVFSSVWQLLDASLEDEGLLECTPDKSSKWLTEIQDMDVDCFQEKKYEYHEGMLKMNTLMAVEMIAESLQNRMTSRILLLVRQNMPSHWRNFVERLQLLAVKSSVLRNSKHASPEIFARMVSDTCNLPLVGAETNLQQQFHAVMAPGSFVLSASQCNGASCSSLWLPIDLFLEDAMDGLVVPSTCAIDTLTVIVKSLQALHSTTWHDTFLGLWIATLRLVQRERNACEGPVPRLDTCMCMLLSIVPLVIVNIIEEEECAVNEESQLGQKVDQQVSETLRRELVSSLQLLGEFEGLLTPPTPVAAIANQAAAKAMMYLSGLSVTSGYLDLLSISDMPMNCGE